jgi:DNA-binding NtrC family response regulator
VLEGIEDLPRDVQAALAQDLSCPDRPTLVATSALPLAQLAAGALVPQLWLRLLPLAQELPMLSTRPLDLPRLAKALLLHLAQEFRIDPPQVEEGAFAELPVAAGFAGVEALLTRLLIETMDGQAISADLVQRAGRAIGQTSAPASPAQRLDTWLSEQMAAGTFSLDAWEARIRRMALAQAHGNVSAAARLLGISRAQLAYREKGGSPEEDGSGQISDP